MTTLEAQVLKSLDHNLHGRPTDAPPLTLAQYNAIALALRERGLLGTQEDTLVNDWTDTRRTVVNAVWLTAQGRQAVEGLPTEVVVASFSNPPRRGTSIVSPRCQVHSVRAR